LGHVALYGLGLSVPATIVNVMANGLMPWERDITNLEVVADWVGRLGSGPILFVVIAMIWNFCTRKRSA
jgi:hypothetical protein